MPTEQEYVAAGVEATMGILGAEHAATVREMEARASDRAWPGIPFGVNPHHLTTARQTLRDEGAIELTIERTKGDRAVSTYHLPRRRGITTTIDRAAARKRLLYSRHQGWARGTRHHPGGLVGPAAERALHATLQQLAPHGYLLEREDPGDVGHLLGLPLAGGPLDSAAYLTLVDPNTGIPGQPITVAIEVKNYRQWIYGDSRQLHLLLHKLAQLQAARPRLPIVPVFVCRKRHETARRLGMALGFYSVQYHTQLVRPVAPLTTTKRHHFEEVRQELGFQDLRLHEQPNRALLLAFDRSLRRDASDTAARWQTFGPPLASHFDRLRRNLSSTTRHEAFEELIEEATQLGAWPPP